MSNILDMKARRELIARIETLTPNHSRKWGKMNINQALRHMNIAFDISMGRLEPHLPGKVKGPKWLMKLFLLNFTIPKEMPFTYKEMDLVRNNIDPDSFEHEQQQLIHKIDEFVVIDFIPPENKVGGKFSKSDWGKLMYRHTDHHLKQFGV